jgi:hypothetical protein
MPATTAAVVQLVHDQLAALTGAAAQQRQRLGDVGAAAA